MMRTKNFYDQWLEHHLLFDTCAPRPRSQVMFIAIQALWLNMIECSNILNKHALGVHFIFCWLSGGLCCTTAREALGHQTAYENGYDNKIGKQKRKYIVITNIIKCNHAWSPHTTVSYFPVVFLFADKLHFNTMDESIAATPTAEEAFLSQFYGEILNAHNDIHHQGPWNYLGPECYSTITHRHISNPFAQIK